MEQHRSEQEQQRISALQELRALGIDPYPAAEYKVTHGTRDLRAHFAQLEAEKTPVCIAGRIRARRIMGSASFVSLQDEGGQIQVYVNRDALCPGEDKTLYNQVFKKLLDLGDIVGFTGYMFTTKSGEQSLHAESLTLLSKAIRPLPVVKEKEGQQFDAFSDPEQRYRQRYVDLVLNAESRDVFIKRSRVVSAMRRWFDSHGCLEVETPILQPLAGGAAARPFVTHHNALDIPLYLRIANELYLKRLIVGGLNGVYELAKDFRNEGMDRTHNPEFSQIEVYVAYKDYLWMMDFTEGLLEYVAKEVLGTTEFESKGHTISFKRPFRRVSMRDLILEHTKYDIYTMDEDALRAACHALGVECDDSMGSGKLIDEIFGAYCEEHLVQPTFVIDYPLEMSPLCKRHRSQEGITERFELFVNGSELCNAYSELNDPIDQLARFREQMALVERGDEEAMRIDYDYVRAMEYGMPPCSGMGIGIDRFCLLLLNQPSIQDVILFPQMKPERVQHRDEDAVFLSAGVPLEWVAPLRALGYSSVARMREAKAGKLLNDLRGYVKKQKLTLPPLTQEDVDRWQGGDSNCKG